MFDAIDKVGLYGLGWIFFAYACECCRILDALMKETP